MLNDPQVITINSVAKTMPRISTSGLASVYQNSDETFKLTVSHQKSGKKIRSMMRVDQRVIVPDPLTSVNDYETLTYYSVIDRPEIGFSLVQVQQLVAGYQVWLEATILGSLYGLQS